MPRSSTTPPRFLIGTALLFWGGITDRPLLGLILALVMESAHWTTLRWEFNEHGFLRAWQISAILIGATMVLLLVDGGRYVAVPRLLGWLPVLLIPVQFTHSFGVKQRMPLTTFSFFARRRMLRNLELGIPVRPVEVNFGMIYLAITVVGSTLGDRADSWWFLVGLVVLTGWAALATGRGRSTAILVSLAMAGSLAIGGQYGLRELYTYLTNGNYGEGEDNTMSSYRTAIGSRGEIKLSSEILWRLKTLQGPTPRLLHTATFNHYDKATWAYRIPTEKLGSKTDFEPLKTINSASGVSYYLTKPDSGIEAIDDKLPRINLRGAILGNSPIPVPGGITALSEFDMDGQERNAVSTVRVFPKSPVVDGVMTWDLLSSPDDPPWVDFWNREKGDIYYPDLRVPPDEAAAVEAVVQELNLRALPLDQKLSVLKEWFADNFRYTRYLSLNSRMSPSRASSALSNFLSTERAGHCEYFASATTLILRAAFVPTRYAIGFAVMESDRSRGGMVIRGYHAHAWCRVWDEANQRWVDFDTTPASWLASEGHNTPWHQPFLDWVQRVREDFFIWRNRPGNSLLMAGVMTSIGLIGAFIIGRNLWRSRRRIGDSAAVYHWDGPIIRTPLHELEPVAAKLLGPRPTGVPLGQWLQGLPPAAGLEEAVDLHQRLRFDPESKSPPTEPRLVELVKQLRAAILEKVRKRS